MNEINFREQNEFSNRAHAFDLIDKQINEKKKTHENRNSFVLFEERRKIREFNRSSKNDGPIVNNK